VWLATASHVFSCGMWMSFLVVSVWSGSVAYCYFCSCLCVWCGQRCARPSRCRLVYVMEFMPTMQIMSLIAFNANALSCCLAVFLNLGNDGQRSHVLICVLLALWGDLQFALICSMKGNWQDQGPHSWTWAIRRLRTVIIVNSSSRCTFHSEATLKNHIIVAVRWCSSRRVPA